MKIASILHECPSASEVGAIYCPSPRGFVFDLKTAPVVAVGVT